MRLQVEMIGDCLGLILPRDLVQRLGLEHGDVLHAASDGYGGLRLTLGDPDPERSMRLFDELIDTHRDTLEALTP